MSNQAKQISDGIAGLGDRIALPRTGFRSPITRSDRAPLRRVGDEPLPEPSPQMAVPPIEAEKPPSRFDRITFEIDPEQRAMLTNIANTLNFRIPRKERTQKINRDMLMRALLTVTESLDWGTEEKLHTEEEIVKFVWDQLELKKPTDKLGGN